MPDNGVLGRETDGPLYTGRRYRLYKATRFNCWKLVLR